MASDDMEAKGDSLGEAGEAHKSLEHTSQNISEEHKHTREIRTVGDLPGQPHLEHDSERGEPQSGLPIAQSKSRLCMRTRGHQAHKHFDAEVTVNHTDTLMILCCVISGFVDSTIYYAYGTFVSMQTGNTIIIGLGGSTGHATSKPYGWAKSLISISCFVLGSFFFSRLNRLLSPLRRSTLILSFLLQAAIIILVAALMQSGAITGNLARIPNDIDWEQIIPIGLLSFQSAGQIVTSRALGLNEIPSVVITSVLCDLVSDPKLFVALPGNAKRNRRVLAFSGILIGAVAGGWLTLRTRRIEWSLWVVGVLKMMTVVAWLVWPEKKSE